MTRNTSIPLSPLLELSAAQLEVALQNSNAQVERLAEAIAAFSRLGSEMTASADAAVAEQGARVAAEAQRALFAMQFHDQLTQRIQHVRDALGDMHDALVAPSPPSSTDLLAAIRGRYSMEDERWLFDVMLGGAEGAQAEHADSDHEALRGSVEMF
jgi:hypothetical protein